MAEHGDFELIVKAHYRGGDFDEGVSPLYDGVASLDGLSKFIHLNTHMLINDEVIKRATALKGAEIYRKPSRSGSFIEVIGIVVICSAAGKIAYSQFGNQLYDLMRYTGSKITGKDVEPTTPKIKSMTEKKKKNISRLCKVLEPSVKLMHRPIEENRDVTLNIERARSSILLFDDATCNVINEEYESDIEYDIQCNVTKMNTLSPNGRLFLDEANKTVPYRIMPSVSFAEKTCLSHSLNERQNMREGKILVDGRKTLDREGKVKALSITGIRHLDNQD